MMAWLADTFVWTAMLIVLVLLVRRPVARHFGPQVAYALWALPLARLFLPPLVLPASLAPALVEMPVKATSFLEPASQGAGWLISITLALWLGGGTVFLFVRARDYWLMRREVLADARPVGEAGKVRLVETPAVSSPLAFGILDRIVALPTGFMDQPDRSARDMAIAHELAHHKGHDLLANVLAQFLLAFHWFNPLAWVAWRAMRSDQEAACDARVMAGCSRDARADYGRLLARCAAGDRLALVDAMASPLLGEKPIIHRLRSLARREVSARRRSIGYRAVAGVGALMLPLTASITYLDTEVASQPKAFPIALSLPVNAHRPEMPLSRSRPEAEPAPTTRESPRKVLRSARSEEVPPAEVQKPAALADNSPAPHDPVASEFHFVSYHQETLFNAGGEMVMMQAVITVVSVPGDALGTEGRRLLPTLLIQDAKAPDMPTDT